MSKSPGDRIVYRQKRMPNAVGRQQRFRTAIALNAEIEHSVRARIVRYGATVAALLLTTAALWPLRETVGLLNAGLIYLMVIVGVTVFAGQKAGIVASLLGFSLFDYFLVPPFLTFAINDAEHVFALFVFLGVSLLISWLLSDARQQAQNAQRRAEDVSRLYELSQAIIGAQSIDEVLPAIAKKVREVFQAQSCWILLPNSQQQLVVRAQAPEGGAHPTRDEFSMAMWSFQHGSDTGRSEAERAEGSMVGNTSHSSSARESVRRSAFVPLRAAGRTIGVLAIAVKRDKQQFTPAEHTVLATFADQAAVALDRLALLREAERAELLARTDELKSALMSAVSHDLRTPLASIMASVTTLLEPNMNWDEETEHDFLQGIYDEARRLNRLVGNLLDMSRIEGGALHPEKDWYTISEVIEAVAQRLEPQLLDRPVTIDIEPGIPMLRFDFTAIDQVLTNLLENAIKYTPNQSAITIGATRVGDFVDVSVADEGKGVPVDQLEHLFDRFYRADRKNVSHGTGLGLAITKGLVEAHGGQIRASNKQTGGLIVTFELPVPTPENGAPGTVVAGVTGNNVDG